MFPQGGITLGRLPGRLRASGEPSAGAVGVQTERALTRPLTPRRFPEAQAPILIGLSSQRQVPKVIENLLHLGRRSQTESSISVNEGEPNLGKAVGGDPGGLRRFEAGSQRTDASRVSAVEVVTVARKPERR